jgi:hypothetical protein
MVKDERWGSFTFQLAHRIPHSLLLKLKLEITVLAGWYLVFRFSLLALPRESQNTGDNLSILASHPTRRESGPSQ